MKFVYHKRFLKNFKKRVLPSPNLVRRYEERLKIFIADPGNPILNDHKLKGERRNYRAFSIGGDVRVVYRSKRGVILFYDIGSHNQVY